jgi:phage FluMu protein Com
LETVADILKSQKRIDKHASADLAENLRKATELMWEAHRLWTALEQESEVAQDKLRKNFGGEQERWRGIAEMWDEMGLVQRIPARNSYCVSLMTRVTQIIRGKCPTCGAIGKASMGTFLEMITCPRCKSTSTFVFLPAATQVTK